MRQEIVEYLMFDGTTKTELKEEDQVNCEAISIRKYFDSEEELLNFKKEWEEDRSKASLITKSL